MTPVRPLRTNNVVGSRWPVAVIANETETTMSLTPKRSLTVGAAVLAGALALTACGSSGPNQTSGSSGGGGSSTATMWGLSQAPFQGVLDTSVQSWNDANPDSPIDVEFFAGEDYKPKVRTAIGAGSAPTFIYGWGGGVLKSYVDEGKVLDLTPYIEENPELKDRYLEAVYENGTVDGKPYALPNSYSQPVMLYYNKTLFEEAGVEPPETWDDLMDLVDVFKKEGVAPFSVGGQSRWPELMWLSYLVDRIGGPEVFESILNNEPEAWSDPAVIEALTKIQELVRAGGFIDGFSSVAADNRADQALLYTGRAAMMVHLAGAYSGIKGDAPDFVANDELGYTRFPAVEGGEGDPENVIGNPSNFWSISADASEEQIDTAIGYLTDEMFSDEYVDSIIEAGSVPALVDVKDKLSQSENKDFMETIYEYASSAPNFQLSWDQALAPEQGEAMLTNLALIFLDQQTPEEFADAMNATLAP